MSATTPTTCPTWCRIGADHHESWNPDPTDGRNLEQHHEAALLLENGMAVHIIGVDHLFLDFEAIQGAVTIADSSRFNRPTPVVHVDVPNSTPLNRRQLRQLHQALTEALAIVDAHTVPGDPMDEGDKRPRIDAGGAIWEWNESTTHWEHVGREMPPQDSLQTLDGPLRFED